MLNMRKWLLVFCVSVITGQTAAQEKCLTQSLLGNVLAANPEYAAIRANERSHARIQAALYNRQEILLKTTGRIKVPVVFHVILNQSQINQLGGTAGILQRAMDQIEVLNEDFNSLNADRSAVPAPFVNTIASLDVEFGLAHRRPDGSSTTGVELQLTTVSGFSAGSGNGSLPKRASTNGVDNWDPYKYLNIWIVNISENNLLGYCVPPSYLNFPGAYSLSDLGVVINYAAFGKRKPGVSFFSPSANDKGRTATHEVGHYFELEHTFGNNSLCPGAGDIDDGIPDTPPQGGPQYGTPAFPQTDACSPDYPGVMFMNFMDYTDDAALLMFTQGQAAYVRNRMNSGILKSLGEHSYLLEWPTGLANIDKEVGFDLFPNPTTGRFTIQYISGAVLQKITILNALGQVVRSITPANRPISNYDLDLTELNSGVYLVQCTFADGISTRKIVLQ